MSRTKEEKNTYTTRYRRSRKGLLTQIYGTQRRSSRKRGHIMPDYTLTDLRDVYLRDALYRILFLRWERSDYNKNLTPSLDRICSDKPYTLDNLQLMTWKENRDKGREELAVKMSIPVDQLTKEGDYIRTYKSLHEAGRQVGVTYSAILKCCKGRQRTSKGFKWRYSKYKTL